MTSDLAEAEVVDSSDNFSQAAHRLCVSEPGSDVAPGQSRAGTISFKKCVSYFAFTTLGIPTVVITARALTFQRLRPSSECAARQPATVWSGRTGMDLSVLVASSTHRG